MESRVIVGFALTRAVTHGASSAFCLARRACPPWLMRAARKRSVRAAGPQPPGKLGVQRNHDGRGNHGDGRAELCLQVISATKPAVSSITWRPRNGPAAMKLPSTRSTGWRRPAPCR